MQKAFQQKTETLSKSPLTHRRPSYPLQSCVPTELCSVSLCAANCTRRRRHLKEPLNTGAMPQKIQTSPTQGTKPERNSKYF
jgi:hypothetical protein